MDWTLFAWGDRGWSDELARGFVVTLSLAVTAYLCGTLLGLGAALLGLRGPRLMRPLAGIYGVLFRSIPELLILFFVYYGLAILLQQAFAAFGWTLSVSLGSFTAGVVALSLVHGAYCAEVFRAAFLAVPRGLMEAARALGLGPWQRFGLVEMPLALRYAFPGLANLWMVMIKNTPLVSAIGLADLIGQARTAGENTKAYFAFFFGALAVYLIMSAVSLVLQLHGEQRLFRHLPTPAGGR